MQVEYYEVYYFCRDHNEYYLRRKNYALSERKNLRTIAIEKLKGEFCLNNINCSLQPIYFRQYSELGFTINEGEIRKNPKYSYNLEYLDTSSVIDKDGNIRRRLVNIKPAKM